MTLTKKKIRYVAHEFEKIFNQNLKLVPLPDESFSYGRYVVRDTNQGKAGLYSSSGTLLDNFNFKTSAVLSAKLTTENKFQLLSEIKDLDRKCWAKYFEVQIFQNNLKKTNNEDRKEYLKLRLENSKFELKDTKHKLKEMFKSLM